MNKLCVIFAFFSVGFLHAQVITIQNTTDYLLKYTLTQNESRAIASVQDVQNVLSQIGMAPKSIPANTATDIHTFAVDYTLVGLLENYASAGTLLLTFPLSVHQGYYIDIAEVISRQDFVVLLPKTARPQQSGTSKGPSIELDFLDWENVPDYRVFDNLFQPLAVYIQDNGDTARQQVMLYQTETWRSQGTLPTTLKFYRTQNTMYLYLHSVEEFGSETDYFLYLFAGKDEQRERYTIEIPVQGEQTGTAWLWQPGGSKKVIGEYANDGNRLQVTMSIREFPIALQTGDNYWALFSSSVYINDRVYEEFFLADFAWGDILR